jgi:dienelactone hydrolase
VALEWYAARDDSGEVREAPAVIVVHETGSQMLAGRLFARGLRAKGLHALMVELPFYGVRYGDGVPAGADTITLFRQGVADIRRARDAVAVLPHIQSDRISLQGTSLGGIAAALAGSLDGAFDRTFLTVAGGDLYELVQNGQREAGMFRRRLKQNGYSDRQLQELFWKIEPTRIAHRLDSETTWLYSAEDDHVIPARHSEALAAAARLPDDHQLVYPGNHYTVFLYFPKVLEHMVEQISTE